ncbi:MAG: LPS export ABC transporter permease LptG [Alphaproteobacteria bacterium]|nr:LPS export ABC transporter permease LptG [Alphaproteobacteria bacterium]
MKITITLSSYLAKLYTFNLIFLLFGLLSVTYLFDTVELIRRASKHDDIPISIVLQMGLLKLPEVGQTLFPFAVLFSAMYTFWQLTRRYELIVVRASGFSVWQFLLPMAVISVLFGALQMTVINPIGAVFISKFEDMEHVYLKRQKNQIAVFDEGLWLRQPVLIDTSPEEIPEENEEDVQQNTSPEEENTNVHSPNLVEGYVIVHAQKVVQPEWVLKNVTVFYFKHNNEFLQRVDAKSATLGKENWFLKEVTIHKSGAPKQFDPRYVLPTTLTVNDIQESFSSPESMSFWKLPDYIRTLEQTGFDATRLKIYYQNLLSQPLMFCAMILLAAAVSMRPPRTKGTFIMIASGVFVGFIVFFLSSFLQAMGSSQQIPVLLAAWSPALISFLLGLSVMMNLEDG